MHPMPFAEWPVAMNYPLHFADHPAHPDLVAADPILLHYHTLVDTSGARLPSPYPTARARLGQFNARLRERMSTGWHYPVVAAASSTISPVREQAPATGTLLIEAGQDAARLRQRLEQLREYQPIRPRAVQLGAGDFKPAAEAVLADLGLSLPYVAFEAGSRGRPVEQVLSHLETRRVGFPAAEADYAPPPWDAVPEAGQALLPWLPAVPMPAASMRNPAALAGGWLAQAGFLRQLSEATSLDDWALWKLADEGLGGRPLDGRAAPANDPVMGAAPIRARQRALTAASSVLAVVASYNCEAYLAQYVEGLVPQTRPPDGIVVVDDGSDVSPADIVRQYPGVTLLTPPHNAGLYRVLQAVVDMTRYDAYLIQNADDWPAINRLELSLPESERTGAELVGSQEVRLLCDQRQIAPVALPLDVNPGSQLMPTGLPMLLGTSLTSRALLRRIGGYATGFLIMADTELVQRAVYAGRVVNLPYYAYYRRKWPSSMSTSVGSRFTWPARLAEKQITNARILHNKAMMESGLPPRRQPPRLAAHVTLQRQLGPKLHVAPGVASEERTTPPAPACLAGMHRSGTSMVARLLNLCGLYLGPDQDTPAPGHDNPEGYWENRQFVRLNEAVLDRWYGAWDLPPAKALEADGTVEQQAQHAVATGLIQTLSQHPWWGWKDPRTSLTLPFWQSLVPDLQVVICVRHPLEVAASLHRRGASSLAFALHLWETYYTRLLETAPPERRIVTDFESYFADAAAETRRMLAALHSSVPEDVVERAATTALPQLRHQLSPDGSLHARVTALVARLCAEAGPVYQRAQTMQRSVAAPDAAAVPDLPATDSRAEPVEPSPLPDWAYERKTIEHLQAGLTVRDHQLAAVLHRAQVAEQEVEALRRAKIDRAAYGYWTLRAQMRQAAAGLKQKARRAWGRVHRRPARLAGLPRKSTEGLDVICFPIIDWEFRFQRPQHLLTQLAAAGHTGYYLGTQFHRDSPHAQWAPLADRLVALTLPGPTQLNLYRDVMSPKDVERCLAALNEFRLAAGLTDTVCLVQWPFWAPLAAAAREPWGWPIVYDCLDGHAGFSNVSAPIRDLERQLLTNSDLVVATSQALLAKAQTAARRALLLPNAADYEHFSRPSAAAPLAALPRPIIGYYGAIADWFDVDLNHAAATARPEWQFVLIGSTFAAAVTALQALPNIHLLGEIPYADLPGYLEALDVACIPLKLTPLTRATNPVKFYEYLSAGKRAATVALPELEPYRALYYPVEQREEFMPKLEAALREQAPEQAATRRQVAGPTPRPSGPPACAARWPRCSARSSSSW